MEMTPLWKSAQDADSHSGLAKPRQERSAFPHFHRPDDEIKSTEKNFRKYFCRTSRTELVLLVTVVAGVVQSVGKSRVFHRDFSKLLWEPASFQGFNRIGTLHNTLRSIFLPTTNSEFPLL